MGIADIRKLAPGSSIDADLCIVGSGPAGMSIALQFAQTGLKVIVLESGGYASDPDTEAFNEIESVGLRRAPQNVTRCRGLGGTSALWSGRCGVLDSMDFQERPWIANSGWPVSRDDIAPFVDRAGRMLGLGPGLYAPSDLCRLTDMRNVPAWDAGSLVPVIFQASLHDAGQSEAVRHFVADGIEGAEQIGALQHAGVPMPRRFGDYYRAALDASENIHVFLGAIVTEIETNETGTIATSLRISTLTGETYRVNAKRIVLACGGIDNARLMLASRSSNPRGVGNAHDMVGRYLMDHPYAPIAFYDDEGSAALRRRLGPIWFDWHGVRHVFSQGLRLHPEIQRREGLLNCAVHMLEFGDAPAPVSRLGRALRLLKAGQIDREMFLEMMGALSDPVRLAAGLVDRYAWKRPSLQRPTRIEFGCVVEQLPDRDSRVSLSEQRDALDMPRAKVDWRAADLEYETACRMAEVLQKEFARLGYTPPRPAEWLSRGPDAYRALIHDMAHPIGTTRMSSDPEHGVVDKNGAVHGVANLFVAGSSTFSTAGYINPTLMIVSFALRLADHLKKTLSQSSIAPDSVKITPAIPVRKRTRIAIVGAGNRIRTIYRPIFEKLSERYEVVGVTSRSAEGARRVADDFHTRPYPGIEELVAAAQPDFILAAVSDTAVEATIGRLVELGIPILVETPFSWNVRNGRRLLKRINDRQIVFGVAEQTPCLPMEQIKQHLIALGLIGAVTGADNDFAIYAYHGTAALKTYTGADRPEAVRAVRTIASEPEFSLKPQAGTVQPWIERSAITTANSLNLLHSQCDKSVHAPSKLSVFGTTGRLVDDELHYTDGGGGSVVSRINRKIDSSGSLETLTVDTPVGEVRWNNPFAGKGFDDEQIAVATVLERMATAVQFGGWPSYDATRAQNDMELLAAIRYSAAMRGRPIRLPLQPRIDAIRSRVVARLSRGG